MNPTINETFFFFLRLHPSSRPPAGKIGCKAAWNYLALVNLRSVCPGPGIAQQSAGYSPDTAAIPDAPQPGLQTSSSAAPDLAASGDAPQDQSGSNDTLKHPEPQNPVPNGRAPQTKRILGIIPNFRSVSTDEKLPPQTVKEKFLTATDDSFDYSSVFIPAFLAAYSMGTNATPEFGHGAVGYGRYFWHAAVDQTSENYMVEFVMPVITHEDTRFYTLSNGGFFKRTGYALSRVIITRTDAGREIIQSERSGWCRRLGRHFHASTTLRASAPLTMSARNGVSMWELMGLLSSSRSSGPTSIAASFARACSTALQHTDSRFLPVEPGFCHFQFESTSNFAADCILACRKHIQTSWNIDFLEAPASKFPH